MNKRLLLSAVILLASANVMADAYKFLTVTCTAKEDYISLPIVQKIAFNEGNCIVTTSEGEYTYPLSEMQKMFFSADDPTAIATLPEKSKDLDFKNGTLQVAGSGILHIYNASGALVQMANVEKGANINLSNLPSGLYIINMGKQNIKIKK